METLHSRWFERVKLTLPQVSTERKRAEAADTTPAPPPQQAAARACARPHVCPTSLDAAAVLRRRSPAPGLCGRASGSGLRRGSWVLGSRGAVFLGEPGMGRLLRPRTLRICACRGVSSHAPWPHRVPEVVLIEALFKGLVPGWDEVSGMSKATKDTLCGSEYPESTKEELLSKALVE